MEYIRTIQQKITDAACSYRGQKETKNNSGFVNPFFEMKMKAQGWKQGEAWCSYFAKLVWMEAYSESLEIKFQLAKLFSPSATATLANFKKSGRFIVSASPVEGAIIIFQHGRSWQGHAGIVTGIDNASKCVVTIEGNTNDDGSREGTTVCQKLRRLNKPFGENELNIIGFIHPTIL